MTYSNAHIYVFSGLGTSQRTGSKQKEFFFFLIYLKCYIISVLNFFGVFRPKKIVFKKIGFPIVFSKVIRVGGDSFFCQKFVSEKAKHPGICPSFCGNVSET